MFDFPSGTQYLGCNQKSVPDVVSLLYFLSNQTYTNRHQLQMFVIRDTRASINVPDHESQQNEYHLRPFRGKTPEQIYEKLSIKANFKTACHSHAPRNEARVPTL